MKRAGAPRTRLVDTVEVRQLRVFLMLVELGRVTSVARALGLAQSTVSETLAALERRLGAAVLVRRRGSADAALLTGAGRALLPHARRILAAVERAQAAVTRAVAETRTQFEIAASESVSTYLLPHALSAVRKRWPQTRFTIRVGSSAEICERVLRDELAVGLLLERADRCGPGSRAARGVASARNQIVIRDIRLAVFAGASHPLRGQSFARSAMTPYPLFVSAGAFEFRDFTRRYMGRRRAAGPRIESAGSVEGVKRSVGSDAAALGLLPAFAIADELRSGNLVRLDLRPPPPRMRLRALLSPSRGRHPALDELLDAIGRDLDSRPPECRLP